MKLAAPNQMRQADSLAMTRYGIPGILLMENAAIHVAKKAHEMLEGDLQKKIIAVAGKGNNGGDAFAAIRHLYQWGYPVAVISLASREEIRDDAKTFLLILENLGIQVSFFSGEDSFPQLNETLRQADLILDGIFGTGIRGEITGIFTSVIQAINNSDVKILSVDIPSGINGKTGQVCGVAVKADETVTFSLPKPGLCQYPGMGHAGNMTVADIGIPAAVIEQSGLTGELLDAQRLLQILPQRPKDGHKGTFGKIMIVTGSTGMTGAGTLAARAAFKTGTGLVYLSVPRSLLPIYSVTIPEGIILPMEEENGGIGYGNLQALIGKSAIMDVVVIGPGLSAKPQVTRWVGDFIAACPKPMVIDADALNAITPEVFLRRKAPTVITPHPGEFARLIGKSSEEIQKDRIGNACAFSMKWNTTVVLKGAGTVIAYPDSGYSINTTGHSGLAVAGSGDVLAGMIGSLIGQQVPPQDAAAMGVFLHGKCGEALVRKNKGQAGFTAGEICGEIPSCIGEIRKDGEEGKCYYGR